MRKLALTLTAATLVLGMTALTASAQTQLPGAAPLANATPITTKVACRGFGPFCPPGWTRRCGPWGCRCVRCW